MKQIL